MSDTRFGRMQKAMALAPLALLSTAWTASLMGVGVGGGAAVATPTEEHRLPDGTSVPSQAIEDPASFTTPGSLGLGVPKGSNDKLVKNASTNGIPSAALSAYQRAATVINAADKGCKLPWQLVAAIGRVESDHGRYGGNTLGKDGVSRPGIYGVPLNGSKNTQAIRDTDAGQYDNDGRWDRAVGPMQFIPSTWSVVGVDADGDGKRNPQDIDDAALAAAVYLCSGNEDLSTEAGQKKAVFRYNHSNSYVALVLDLTKAYLQGDFTSVPNNTTSAVTFNPNTTNTRPRDLTPTDEPRTDDGPRNVDSGKPKTDTSPKGGDNGGDQGGDDSNPGDDGGKDGDNAGGDKNKPDNPVKDLKKKGEKLGKDLEDTLKNPEKALPKTLTRAEATVKCLASGISKLDVFGLTKCVDRLLGL